MSTNDLIFYGGVIGVIVVLFALIYLQNQANKEHEGNVISANTALKIATQDLNLVRKNLFDSIKDVYGQETTDIIEKGGVYIGMPNYLVITSKGYADNIKESFSKGIRVEKWLYGEYTNRLGNYNYTFEVTLENDEVVGWKDLK